MKHDYFKYYKPSFLITLIALFSIAIFLAKDQWQVSIPIIGTITALVVFISQYLWKFKPFIWLFWFDDFSGRYEGKLKYQYFDENGNLNTGELEHIKIINQKGHRITVSSFNIKPDGLKSSESISKGLYLEKTEDEQHFNIIYNYLNDGCIEQGFPQHYGTEVIKFRKKEKEKFLSGRYYTERQPFQTKGELIDLKWVSNNLDHEF